MNLFIMSGALLKRTYMSGEQEEEPHKRERRFFFFSSVLRGACFSSELSINRLPENIYATIYWVHCGEEG